MELEDTISLMTSEDYVDRLKAEYYQLKIRTNKLAIMLENYKAGSLPFQPTCSYEVLHEQLVFMKAYLRILELRADIENIHLSPTPVLAQGYSRIDNRKGQRAK